MANVAKTIVILLLLWCLWAVDSLDSNMLILREQLQATQAAHNKLVEVVYAISAR